MELRQLEYFCAIADAGSINEAARRLHLSQPPLSYQLRQLEEELKVTLFQRTRRGVELTEAGRLLYDRASDLLRYAGATRQEVAEAGKRRVLRLGLTSTTVGTLMPYLSRFCRRYPEVRFQVQDGSTFTLYHALLEGILDVSVVRTPLQLDEVSFRLLQREPMLAASSPEAPMPAGASLPLSALAGRPLILYRRYEALIHGAFRRQGLEPEVLCLCDDARDAMLWARAGLATALFPQSMSSQCAGLRLQTLEEPSLETQSVLIWKKDRRPGPVLQDFLTLLAEEDRA